MQMEKQSSQAQKNQHDALYDGAGLWNQRWRAVVSNSAPASFLPAVEVCPANDIFICVFGGHRDDK